jgi:chitodextrinase
VTGSALTITAWVNHSSLPFYSDQRILSKASDSTEQGHYWMLSGTGRRLLQFRVKAGGSTTTLIAGAGDVPIGAWYHAAATYDGATMRLYLNGVEVGSAAKTGAIAASAAVPVNIGRNPDGSNYLHGLIDDVRIYSRALTPAEIQSVLNNEGPSEPPPNQPPAVSLTSPSNGATFTAPATITLTAAASDPEGDLDRVDFYSGSTLLNSDASAPYSFTWSAVPAGTYVFTAVARDGDGASTTSTAASVTVSGDSPLQTTWQVAFTASTNHEGSVTNYLVKVFSISADPLTDIPLATSDLGKPVPDVNREVVVDRTAFFGALPIASYLVTVTAIGPGGSATSNVFAFTR